MLAVARKSYIRVWDYRNPFKKHAYLCAYISSIKRCDQTGEAVRIPRSVAFDFICRQRKSARRMKSSERHEN